MHLIDEFVDHMYVGVKAVFQLTDTSALPQQTTDCDTYPLYNTKQCMHKTAGSYNNSLFSCSPSLPLPGCSTQTDDGKDTCQPPEEEDAAGY